MRASWNILEQFTPSLSACEASHAGSDNVFYFYSSDHIFNYKRVSTLHMVDFLYGKILTCNITCVKRKLFFMRALKYRWKKAKFQNVFWSLEKRNTKQTPVLIGSLLYFRSTSDIIKLSRIQNCINNGIFIPANQNFWILANYAWYSFLSPRFYTYTE